MIDSKGQFLVVLGSVPARRGPVSIAGWGFERGVQLPGPKKCGEKSCAAMKKPKFGLNQ
jgi:hypothetical protein